MIEVHSRELSLDLPAEVTMILGSVGFCVCAVLSVQSLLWVGRSYLCSLAASHLALGAPLPCGEDGDGLACPIPTPLFSVQGTICPLPFILPSHSGPLLPTVNSLSPLLAHLLGNLASTLIPPLSGTFRHSLPATSSSGISLQVLPCPPLVSAALKDAHPFLPVPLVTPQPAPVVFRVHSVWHPFGGRSWLTGGPGGGGWGSSEGLGLGEQFHRDATHPGSLSASDILRPVPHPWE